MRGVIVQFSALFSHAAKAKAYAEALMATARLEARANAEAKEMAAREAEAAAAAAAAKAQAELEERETAMREAEAAEAAKKHAALEEARKQREAVEAAEAVKAAAEAAKAEAARAAQAPSTPAAQPISLDAPSSTSSSLAEQQHLIQIESSPEAERFIGVVSGCTQAHPPSLFIRLRPFFGLRHLPAHPALPAPRSPLLHSPIPAPPCPSLSNLSASTPHTELARGAYVLPLPFTPCDLGCRRSRHSVPMSSVRECSSSPKRTSGA